MIDMTGILIVEDVGLQYFDNCMAIKYETINIVLHYSNCQNTASE